MKSIEIPVKDIRAVSLFAAKNDVRYYLNTIAIHEGHLVGTNGHCLLAVPLPGVDHEFSHIIPMEAIQQALKLTTEKQKKESSFLFSLGAVGKTSTIQCENGGTIPYTCLDAKFPKWEQLVPSEDEAPELHTYFDWDYMAKFKKAAMYLTGKKYETPRLIPHGLKPARIVIESLSEAIGVLMPMRGEA